MSDKTLERQDGNGVSGGAILAIDSLGTKGSNGLADACPCKKRQMS